MEEKIIQTQLSQLCWKLDENQKFSDIVLQINDAQLYCHRFILAAFSPFFKAMFANDMKESREKVVYLKEIDTQATTDIIRYMYGKKLKITAQNAQSLAVTASRFCMTPIENECCAILSNINIDNFVDMYLFAEKYRFLPILDASYQFMLSKFKKCSENSKFHQIKSWMLKKCLQSNELYISNEVDLLYALERWYKDCNPKCEDNILVQLFESIRLPIIPMKDLSKFEQDSKLLQGSKCCLDLINKIKAFDISPERHFSKLCRLNYRCYTNNFKLIIKSWKNKDDSAENMPEFKVNNEPLNYGDTFNDVEAINRIDYAATMIGHNLFLMGGMTKGTYFYIFALYM